MNDENFPQDLLLMNDSNYLCIETSFSPSMNNKIDEWSKYCDEWWRWLIRFTEDDWFKLLRRLLMKIIDDEWFKLSIRFIEDEWRWFSIKFIDDEWFILSTRFIEDV